MDENNGWISVKSRKPPHRKMVLLANNSAKDKFDNWVVAGERVGSKYWNQFQYESAGDCDIFPTHWMPLPSPPKTSDK